MAPRPPAAAAALLLLVSAAIASAQESPSTLRFEIPEYDLYPESIAHDPVSGDFFLGSMSHSRILRIEADGSYTDFLPHPPAELLSTIGMKADAERRRLWVCSGRFNLYADYDVAPARTGVLLFDIDDGELLGAWMMEQASDRSIASPPDTTNRRWCTNSTRAGTTTESPSVP